MIALQAGKIARLEVEMLGRPAFEQFGRIFEIDNAEIAPTTLEEGLTEANPAGQSHSSCMQGVLVGLLANTYH